MAIIIIANVPGQTKEGYDSTLTPLREAIKKVPGFVMHCSHPSEDGWSVYEVWQSKADADAWFAKSVMPFLPPGIHPKRHYQELYSMVTPS